MLSPEHTPTRWLALGAALLIATLICSPTVLADDLDEIIHQLGDGDEDERVDAADELSEHPDPKAVKARMAALDDSSEEVREKAVWALGKIEDRSAIPALAKMVEDREESVRMEAVKALLEMHLDVSGSAMVSNIFGAFMAREEIAVAPDVKLDPVAVEAVITALKDREENIRRYAAEVLGTMRARSAVPALVGALSDREEDVRAEAARSLGRIGDPSAESPLIAALDDREEDVRAAAAAALGKVGTDKSVEPLVKAYTKDDDEVRIGAAEGLAGIGSPKTHDLFVEMLDSREDQIRRFGAEGLGRAGSDADTALLEKKLGAEEDRSTQIAMTYALYLLGQEHRLRDLFQTFNELRYRNQTEAYLVQLGDKMVPQLLPLLDDPDDQRVAFLCRVLGKIGSDQAIPALRKLRDHSDLAVRKESQAAIERIMD